jgi:hypothetical protein
MVSGLKGGKKSSTHSRRGMLGRVCAVLGAVAALFLAVLVIVRHVESDQAGIAALCVLAAVALLVMALTPYERVENLLKNFKSFQFGSISVEMRDYAARAASGKEGQNEEDPAHAGTLLELHAELESRLVYLAKHHFGDDTDKKNLRPTFLNVGSLRHDQYLTTEQTQIAYDILGMRQIEFNSMALAERKLFVDGASPFVDTFRVQVFVNEIIKELASRGWKSEPAYPDSKRRDLRVSREKSQSTVAHQVVPVYANNVDSPLVQNVQERLRADHGIARGGGLKFVVVPPRSKAVDGINKPDKPASASVVTLRTLLEKLGSGQRRMTLG